MSIHSCDGNSPTHLTSDTKDQQVKDSQHSQRSQLSSVSGPLNCCSAQPPVCLSGSTIHQSARSALGPGAALLPHWLPQPCILTLAWLHSSLTCRGSCSPAADFGSLSRQHRLHLRFYRIACGITWNCCSLFNFWHTFCNSDVCACICMCVCMYICMYMCVYHVVWYES